MMNNPTLAEICVVLSFKLLLLPHLFPLLCRVDDETEGGKNRQKEFIGQYHQYLKRTVKRANLMFPSDVYRIPASISTNAGTAQADIGLWMAANGASRSWIRSSVLSSSSPLKRRT